MIDLFKPFDPRSEECIAAVDRISETFSAYGRNLGVGADVAVISAHIIADVIQILASTGGDNAAITEWVLGRAEVFVYNDREREPR